MTPIEQFTTEDIIGLNLKDSLEVNINILTNACIHILLLIDEKVFLEMYVHLIEFCTYQIFTI
jgi:hypothetical protein